MADPWRMLVVCLTILLAGQPASAQSVSFPSVTVGSSQAGPEVNGWIYKPPGEGPFPAIILAHSCAGRNQHTDVWGKLLVSWGYLVLAPDVVKGRIGIIGHSHGGSTVMRSSQKSFGLRHRRRARRRGADEGVLREVLAMTHWSAPLQWRSCSSAEYERHWSGALRCGYLASASPICRHSSTRVS